MPNPPPIRCLDSLRGLLPKNPEIERKGSLGKKKEGFEYLDSLSIHVLATWRLVESGSPREKQTRGKLGREGKPKRKHLQYRGSPSSLATLLREFARDKE